MKQETIISVKNLLNSIIGSRDSVEKIRSEALRTPTHRVILDFTEVEFISRSAADELLLIKEDLARKLLKKRELVIERANNAVADMFKAVAATRAMPKKKEYPQIQKGDFSSLLHHKPI